jgi:2-polyprenyl-6-methoxyphenol hydroxylase-like FAD-dependent oxidoreductase
MTERADVVIVGGGFTGASLACALADGKRRVVVFEARRAPAARFAGELLHPSRLDVLDEALLARLRCRGAEVRGFAVVPAPGGAATLLPYPGPRRGLGIEHTALVAELRHAAAERAGVELRLGAHAEVIFDEGRAIGVRTDEGDRVNADLVLGAEGRHSPLRARLGLAAETRLVSFTAALRVRDAELPHAGFGHVLLGAPGPILAYPIGGGDVRMCFDLPGERHLLSVPDRLRADYALAVPEPLRSAMLRALDGEELQLVANHAVRTRRCIAPGAALVGDAGGCAHPLTAAGMSVCLNDVQLIADELARGRPGRAALRRFERRRYRFARTREMLTDALYRLVTHRGASGQALRDSLFGYWRSPRARARSIVLLSGEESSPRALHREWACVIVGAAVRAARAGALRDLVAFIGAHFGRLNR